MKSVKGIATQKNGQRAKRKYTCLQYTVVCIDDQKDHGFMK